MRDIIDKSISNIEEIEIWEVDEEQKSD